MKVFLFPNTLFLRFCRSGLLRSVLWVSLTLDFHAARAQSFDSGSDGSFGAIDVTSDSTIPLPPDGIIHATTVNVESGRTLSFTRNVRNTPVYLLATGDVTIAGIVTVDAGDAPGGGDPAGGVPGPGGFAGGEGGNPTEGRAPGAGKGPGGGGAGADANAAEGAGGGSYSAQGSGNSSAKGAVYGNDLLVPLLGGSGGGGRPAEGGHGGGGAILIASNTKIAITSGQARIYARGGGRGDSVAGGSGGAVRMVAPKVMAENFGDISVQPGARGGPGRVRVDAITREPWELDVQGGPNVATYGTVLFTGIDLPYGITLVSVAGETVPSDATEPALVTLPIGSDRQQEVIVRLEGFRGFVPLEVVLTPDNGSAVSLETQVDMGDGSTPRSFPVEITFPATNVGTRIDVWTR